MYARSIQLASSISRCLSRVALLRRCPLPTWASFVSAAGSGRRSDAEWKRLLSPDVYWVTRQGGTEAPHSGEYAELLPTGGVFRCACCQAALFAPRAKFASGCGWPAFSSALDGGKAVSRRADGSHSMSRVEVLCARCDAHLGHVFPDGPPPAGERYCINSLAIDWDEHAASSSDSSGK